MLKEEAVMDMQLWQCVWGGGVDLLLGMKASDFTVSRLLLLRMTSAPVWMCLVMLICMLKDGEMVDYSVITPRLGDLQLPQWVHRFPSSA